jgi:D-xylose transport system substrate-binding protein
MIAANDGLAGAVIAALKAKGLKPIPLTGQDATPTGVQFILAGWQTGTVYKSVRKEANAAAAAAIAIIKHRKVRGVNGKTSGTPSILLTPVWITKKNYKLLFTDGFLKKSQVCVGQYKKYCK